MSKKTLDQIDDERKQIIKEWGQVMVGLDEDNKADMKLAMLEADVVVLLSAATTYAAMKEIVSPASQIAKYLDQAGAVYLSRAKELLRLK